MTTPRLGLPLPVGSDQITTLTTGPHDIRQLATTLDNAAMFGSSVHSLRPAASLAGRIWLSTDTGQVGLDTGTAWIEIARTAVAATPPGVMFFYAGDTAPDGFLLCDGAAVSRTTYAALFSAIGTRHGIGDGSTTFNVPDRRGRVDMGSGQGTGLSSRTVGQKPGAEGLPAHDHDKGTLATTSAGDHDHAASAGNNFGQQTPQLQESPSSVTRFLWVFSESGGPRTSFGGAHVHLVTGRVGSAGSGSHGVVQPSYVSTAIIKT